MKIRFIPSSLEVEMSVPCPKPSARLLPDWYKSTRLFGESGTPEYSNGHITNMTVKSCMPFLDGLSFGYIQETWADIHIESDGQSLSIDVSRNLEMIDSRQAISVPISDEFHNIEFVWKQPWIPVTPTGYSVFVTSPVNHFELPFMCGSGVIDSDSFHHTYFGNVPFWIKKGFSGTIPAGTPMYQIIPFKRDSWESSKSSFDQKEMLAKGSVTKTNFYGVYKKLFHHKKSFK